MLTVSLCADLFALYTVLDVERMYCMQKGHMCVTCPLLTVCDMWRENKSIRNFRHTYKNCPGYAVQMLALYSFETCEGLVGASLSMPHSSMESSKSSLYYVIYVRTYVHFTPCALLRVGLHTVCQSRPLSC